MARRRLKDDEQRYRDFVRDNAGASPTDLAARLKLAPGVLRAFAKRLDRENNPRPSRRRERRRARPAAPAFTGAQPGLRIAPTLPEPVPARQPLDSPLRRGGAEKPEEKKDNGQLRRQQQTDLARPLGRADDRGGADEVHDSAPDQE
jgi:hypothetical protein